jgi:hypothetical protein
MRATPRNGRLEPWKHSVEIREFSLRGWGTNLETAVTGQAMIQYKDHRELRSDEIQRAVR